MYNPFLAGLNHDEDELFMIVESVFEASAYRKMACRTCHPAHSVLPPTFLLKNAEPMIPAVLDED